MSNVYFYCSTHNFQRLVVNGVIANKCPVGNCGLSYVLLSDYELNTYGSIIESIGASQFLHDIKTMSKSISTK